MSVHIIRKGIDKRFVDTLIYVNEDIDAIFIEENNNRKKWRREFVDCRRIFHLPAHHISTQNDSTIVKIITNAAQSYPSIAIPLSIFPSPSLSYVFNIFSTFDWIDSLIYLIVDNQTLLSEERYIDIDQYIFEKYVSSEVTISHDPRIEHKKASLSYNNWFDKYHPTSEDDDEYLNDVLAILKRSSGGPPSSSNYNVQSANNDILSPLSSKLSLEEFVNTPSPTFSDALFKFIDDKKYDEVECYKRANVNRRTFSKIKTDKGYHPSKKTVFAFAISLELNYEETKYLLKTAGYAFSNSNKMDLIVEYFILKGCYDMYEINDALFSFGQPLLGL